MHCQIAECSLSKGIISELVVLLISISRSPQATKLSLLAKAIFLPCLIQLSTGKNQKYQIMQ